jgi:hypothetical protein
MLGANQDERHWQCLFTEQISGPLCQNLAGTIHSGCEGERGGRGWLQNRKALGSSVRARYRKELIAVRQTPPASRPFADEVSVRSGYAKPPVLQCNQPGRNVRPASERVNGGR